MRSDSRYIFFSFLLPEHLVDEAFACFCDEFEIYRKSIRRNNISHWIPLAFAIRYAAAYKYSCLADWMQGRGPIQPVLAHANSATESPAQRACSYVSRAIIGFFLVIINLASIFSAGGNVSPILQVLLISVGPIMMISRNADRRGEFLFISFLHVIFIGGMFGFFIGLLFENMRELVMSVLNISHNHYTESSYATRLALTCFQLSFIPMGAVLNLKRKMRADVT